MQEPTTEFEWPPECDTAAIATAQHTTNKIVGGNAQSARKEDTEVQTANTRTPTPQKEQKMRRKS